MAGDLDNLIVPAAVDVLLVDEAEGEHAVPSEHRYRTTWRVAMNTDLATAFDVLQTPAPLPQPGDPYAALRYEDGTYLTGDGYVPGEVLDEFAVVVLRTARRDPENPYWWVVQVSYEGATDPTAEPADVDYDDVPYQDYTTQDIYGSPVANSALDPFDGGVPVDRSRTSLVIVRNVPFDGWDPELAEKFKNTLNLKPYRHGSITDEFNEPIEAAPGTAKLTGLRAKRMTRSKGATAADAKFYWQVRAQIDFDSATFVLPGGRREAARWRRVLLDAGYRKIVDGDRRAIYTTATKPTHPPLLDGKGLPLPPPPEGAVALPTPFPSGPVIDPQNGTFGVAGGTLSVPAPGLLSLVPGATSVSADPALTPTRGTLTINPDGSFTYVVTGDPGWDTFGFLANCDPDPPGKAAARVLVGPQPVFLAFDVYPAADWSDIVQWVGDW